MSTAEKLAEALEELHIVCALALAGKDGLQYAYFESRSGHFVSAAPSMAKAESAIAAYRAQPAADGAQRVVERRLTRSQINKLSGEAQTQFCLDKQPTYEVAFARAVETHLAAAWGVKLDGEA